MSVRLSSSSSTVIPTFFAISSSVGARPELRLERRDRALDLARPRAHRARHPVHRAQLVDDRALDARDRVRLELHVAVGLVALDRADQAEQAVRDEVALVDVRGQAAPEAAGDVLHERRVREDQPVAECPGRPSCGTAAKGSGSRRPGSRVREYGVPGTFPQRRSAERASEPSQPASARAATATTSRPAPPPAPANAATATSEERRREHEKESAERAPLHARSVMRRLRERPIPGATIRRSPGA